MIKISSITTLATDFGWEHVRTVRTSEHTGHFFRRSGANLMCLVGWNGDVEQAVTVTPDGVTATVANDHPVLAGELDRVAGAVQTFIFQHAAPVSLVKNDTRPAWLRWVHSAS